MKQSLFLSLIAMALLFGCGKTSTETLDEMVNVEGVLKNSGNFRGYGSENVSGKSICSYTL